jgi:hypothetical protein
MGIEIGSLERFLGRIEGRVEQLKSNEMKVGFMGNDRYEATGESVAAIATLQEYGGGNTPARPFFRPLAAAKKDEWVERTTVLLGSGMPVGQVLATLGKMISEELKMQIGEGDHDPLSPLTLMIRKMKDERPELKTRPLTGAEIGEAAARVAAGEQGATGTRARPLVDTGRLLAAPTFVVGSESEPA